MLESGSAKYYQVHALNRGWVRQFRPPRSVMCAVLVRRAKRGWKIGDAFQLCPWCPQITGFCWFPNLPSSQLTTHIFARLQHRRRHGCRMSKVSPHSRQHTALVRCLVQATSKIRLTSNLKQLKQIEKPPRKHSAPVVTMGGNSSQPRGTTQIDLLYQQILDEVKSPRGKNFLAADQIEALATYETVNRVLFEAKVPKSQEVAAYVVEKHAKRVFLSLVYCGRVQCMKALKDHSPQLCDNHLPVRLDDDHNLVTIDASESSQGDGRWPLDLNVRDRESMGAKMLFETAQWNFLSPIFTKEKFYYEFEPGVRLPFLKKSDVVKNGAFGSVREVELYHSHQDIVPGVGTFR